MATTDLTCDFVQLKSETEQSSKQSQGLDSNKVKVSSTCNGNIFNAFLILQFRDFEAAENDLEWREINDHNYANNLKIGLCVISYLVMFCQYAAFALLVHVIILSSNKSYHDWPWNSDINSDKTYYLFPFFVIAIIAASKEVSTAHIDLLILSHWNIYNFGGNRARDIHVYLLKFMGEIVFGFFGSIIYFGILSLYSTTENWEDILNVILNLLAYQFILDADEWTYEWFARIKIEHFVARTSSKEINILEGEYWIEGKPSTLVSFWVYVNMASVIIYSIFVQALLSNNYVLVQVLLWTVGACICTYFCMVLANILKK